MIHNAVVPDAWIEHVICVAVALIVIANAVAAEIVGVIAAIIVNVMVKANA